MSHSSLMRVGAFAQVEFFLQLFAQVAAAAFGEDGVLGVQLHAGGIAGLVLAVVADAGIAGGDTFHRTIFVVEYFAGGKAGEDLDAQTFGLFCQPAAQVTQGNDVVPFVVHGLGYEQVRHFLCLFRAGEVVDLVAGDLGVHRSAHFLPVGKQLVQGARLKHRTGENMGTDFGAFLYHDHTDFLTGFLGDLAQTAGGCQTGRTGADDDYIDFHRFAFHSLSPRYRLRVRP